MLLENNPTPSAAHRRGRLFLFAGQGKAVRSLESGGVDMEEKEAGVGGSGRYNVAAKGDRDMRDHSTLRAFQLADALAIAVYKATAAFPKEEQFGLTAQMRRAAVSAASNIVEGCARDTQADLLRFLDMAHGSARELEYQLSLAARLGLLRGPASAPLQEKCVETVKVMSGLIRYLRGRASKRKDSQ